MYTDFHELKIWQIGYDLLMRIYTLSESFPYVEQYAITSQIRRSGNSIIANIAEAHGRYSYQDKIRVLYIARGEIAETRSHLAVVLGRKYISTEVFIELNEKYASLARKLNSYINSIQSHKSTD